MRKAPLYLKFHKHHLLSVQLLSLSLHTFEALAFWTTYMFHHLIPKLPVFCSKNRLSNCLNSWEKEEMPFSSSFWWFELSKKPIQSTKSPDAWTKELKSFFLDFNQLLLYLTLSMNFEINFFYLECADKGYEEECLGKSWFKRGLILCGSDPVPLK